MEWIILLDLLKKYHFNIDYCNSGLTCLAKVKSSNDYDIILLDDMMPHMSGKQTLVKLKEQGITTPIIALTANAITGMKEEYIHVFKRNMDTVNVTLEHVLYNSSIPRDIIKGNFELIRKVVDHCEELALDEIPTDEENSLTHNTEQLRIGIVDERTKKAIENNVMMFNSGIRLLCCGGRISADMIECEFRALQLLLDDCKRRLYNTIED